MEAGQLEHGITTEVFGVSQGVISRIVFIDSGGIQWRQGQGRLLIILD